MDKSRVRRVTTRTTLRQLERATLARISLRKIPLRKDSPRPPNPASALGLRRSFVAVLLNWNEISVPQESPSFVGFIIGLMQETFKTCHPHCTCYCCHRCCLLSHRAASPSYTQTQRHTHTRTHKHSWITNISETSIQPRTKAEIKAAGRSLRLPCDIRFIFGQFGPADETETDLGPASLAEVFPAKMDSRLSPFVRLRRSRQQLLPGRPSVPNSRLFFSMSDSL